MFEIINRMFNKENNPSKEVAKERLRLVLVHDRVNVSPKFMELIKEDMIRTISNYMEIDEETMEIHLANNSSSVALTANIPVKRMKRNAVTDEI